jgi:striatin 1/3/4
MEAMTVRLLSSAILCLDSNPATQINAIKLHPELSLLATAHENKFLRIYDVKSGNCIHSVAAHPDALSSIDIEPSSHVLVSGGHDGSVRFWDLRKYTCLQDIAAHRRKFDEGVCSVRFHPMQSFFPWVASSGADSVIKLYS